MQLIRLSRRSIGDNDRHGLVVHLSDSNDQSGARLWSWLPENLRETTINYVTGGGEWKFGGGHLVLLSLIRHSVLQRAIR